MCIVDWIALPALCSELFPNVGSSQVGSLGFLRGPPPPPEARGVKDSRRCARWNERGGARRAGGLLEFAHSALSLGGSYLDELSIAGECAAEYLALYQKLITSAHWKVYLAARGVLPYVGNLITKVPTPQPREALSLLLLSGCSFLDVNFTVFFLAKKKYLLRISL